MNIERPRGYPKSPEPKKGSLRAKSIGFFAVAVMSTFLLPACTDPFYKGSDAYYAEVDPSVARAMAIATQKAINKQGNNSLNQQKIDETPEPQTPVLSNSSIFCATVAPDGSVSETIEIANGGTFPGTVVNNLILQVRIDHRGSWTITGLEEIMTTGKNSAVDPGDRVCISTNPQLLEQQPTPTK